MPEYLNLGCGRRFHSAFVNVDFAPADKQVIACDLRRGIPFDSGRFDLVYHSHLLEHMPRAQAEPFLKECLRVLKPGGVIRIAVPDLEGIARAYLDALERARRGEPGGDADRDWMTLELYDQAVRERSGGEMIERLRRADGPALEFIIRRIGSEAEGILERLREAEETEKRGTREPIWRRAARNPASAVRASLARIRELSLRLALGSDDYRALGVGRFRGRGEIHLWMHDAFSLGNLLAKCGFENSRRVGPSESAIEEWGGFQLDADAAGKPHKPDSLFMEARRPA